ncbi:hypothetical protein [Agromyces ramosus]|uniref:Flagellin-like protein n=1 Tax=Agromyces ramosus TaxID=33879 RepID=A0ABU0R4V2_9MICO|nr:hypothetical protein [Agromyces ramosus]MDQ0892767.1 hypothetical protein [Agromyces ramosus]
MSEQTEPRPVRVADHLTDREAGQLLLAFLTTVVLILAAGSFL